ncbi:hypothetical protein [Spirillospora sp. NPDC047279]
MRVARLRDRATILWNEMKDFMDAEEERVRKGKGTIPGTLN